MRTEASSESDAGNRVLVGKCECGSVRYRVVDAFLYASNCRCSREKLELTDGRDALLVVLRPWLLGCESSSAR